MSVEGRFDERFFIDLPGVKAREEIFLHHLQKRFPKSDFSQFGLENFAKESNGFTGAEIEALIVEAKNHARSVDSPITPGILNECLDNMTPDSVAMTKTISHIRELWGGDRARRADDEDPVDLQEGKAFQSRIAAAVDEQEKRRSMRRY